MDGDLLQHNGKSVLCSCFLCASKILFTHFVDNPFSKMWRNNISLSVEHLLAILCVLVTLFCDLKIGKQLLKIPSTKSALKTAKH